MLDLIGHDVILKDATQNLPDSSFGVWAIEIPRVYADPEVEPPEDGADFSASCWESGYVPRLYDDKGEVDPKADYYTRAISGRCVLVDPFTADDFTTMSFATRFPALLTERALVVGLLNELCAANPYYPAAYCSFDDEKAPADPDNDPGSQDFLVGDADL